LNSKKKITGGLEGKEASATLVVAADEVRPTGGCGGHPKDQRRGGTELTA